MDINNFTIKHSFSNFAVDFTFSIKNAQIVCIFGKSGSGKSTILRALSGLNSKALIDKEKLAFLFQDNSVFTNFNVWENIVFSTTKTLKDEIKYYLKSYLSFKEKKYFLYLLRLAKLNHLRYEKVDNLSGGQRQRLALLCALAKNSEFILLDEPFSALDDENKENLMKFIAKINKEFKNKIIFVSHSKYEIYSLADVIYEIEDGKNKKIYTKEEFKKEKIGKI